MSDEAGGVRAAFRGGIGVWRGRRVWLLAPVLGLLWVQAVWAQPGEGDVFIDVNVNYRLGYRDGTWVPVDVLVDNRMRDFTGYVEVRTYAGDTLLSPVYRIPAQSPKSSKKRFRFHCHLNRATRLEAMLYHKRKPVLPVPSWLDLRPIREQDLLGLVLDEEPTDYGFLNAAFATFRTEEDPVRFYREEVPRGALHLLADFPQCYEPYDAVMIALWKFFIIC